MGGLLPYRKILVPGAVVVFLLWGGGLCLYSGRHHGQSCEEGETCHGRHVTCLVSGLCGCSSPEDMTFDPQSQACNVKVGKACDSSWELIDCTEGARCVDGICRCESGFYASSVVGGSADPSCVPKKLYNQSCERDVECATATCLNQLCQCDKRIEVYEGKRESCVGLVDSECEAEGTPCTGNAVCRKLSPLGKMGDLTSVRETCQCVSGYAKTSEGKCGKGYGQLCGGDEGTPCADIHFICIEGNCTCKYPLHQIYDHRIAECLSLVSGPCTFPKNNQMNLGDFHDIQKCVKNAECMDKGFYSDCECKSGYVQTRAGRCSPTFGQRCENGDCDPDHITQLVCRNGVCECLDLLQVYDRSMKKCRGLVGSRCTTEEPECVEYATCIVPDPPFPGKCICDKYSTEVINRTCEYH